MISKLGCYLARGFKGLIPHFWFSKNERGSRLSRNQRTLNSAHGGVLSGDAFRERII